MRTTNEKFANDFNILLYAKENDMILVTKDKEPGKACQTNGIKCIWLSDDILFDKVILPELAKYT